MSQREGWNMCRIICWMLAAVVGILVIKGIIGAVGFIAAVMAGAALAVFIGLVLTRLFCMKQGAGAAMVPTAEAAKESAANAAQATTPAAADAGAKAKETAADAGAKAEEAGTKAKETAAQAGAKAKEAAADAGAKAKGAAADAGAKAKDTAGDAAAKATGKSAAKASGNAGKTTATAGAKSTAKPAAKATAKSAAKPTAKPAAKATAKTAEAAEDSGTRPEALSAPKGGKADNLKEIKGVGPKLETMLNEMGFYHFDQIASWGPKEVTWMDGNIKGFKGRVSRDNWVEQAKVLASGGETEFSKRVDDGDVY